MSELTRGNTAPASTPEAALATRRVISTLDGPGTGWRTGFFVLLKRLWAHGTIRRSRLPQLTDEQIRDSGIDPARAGRGRAAAVRFDPNIGSGH